MTLPFQSFFSGVPQHQVHQFKCRLSNFRTSDLCWAAALRTPGVLWLVATAQAAALLPCRVRRRCSVDVMAVGGVRQEQHEAATIAAAAAHARADAANSALRAERTTWTLQASKWQDQLHLCGAGCAPCRNTETVVISQCHRKHVPRTVECLNTY